jgi:hypothetical protein
MFNLPHMLLSERSRREGVAEGRKLENDEICIYIEKLHPALSWLANAIRHGEHK